MTNLELMICEAENSGEIDLETRDMLLDVLNESGGDYEPHIKKAGDKKWALSKKIEVIKNKIEKEEDAILSYKKRSDSDAKVIIKQMSEINHGFKSMVPGTNKKLNILRDRLNEINDKELSFRKDREKTINTLKVNANKLIKEFNRIGFSTQDQTDELRRYCKEKYGIDMYANIYQGVKESVLEEIYEAELCGDITPEERMALIDYMED